MARLANNDVAGPELSNAPCGTMVVAVLPSGIRIEP
jgi:hypothetical protein